MQKNEIDCRTGIPGKKITCILAVIPYNNYDDTTATRTYYRNQLFINFSAFKGESYMARAIIPVSSTGGVFPEDVSIASVDKALNLLTRGESWKFESMTYIKLRVDEANKRTNAFFPSEKDYTIRKNIPSEGSKEDKWYLKS